MPDIFTLEELVSYLQIPEFDTFTATLARELATTKIRYAAGARLYDALTDLSPLRPIALDLAKRIVTNPEGLRSSSIDDYSETYATETIGSDLTATEIAEVRRIAGRSSGFSIRPQPPTQCVDTLQCVDPVQPWWWRS